MQRAREQRRLAGRLHHLAQVHHRHPVGDVSHDSQVMRDEQIGEAELPLERAQQVDHLGAYRHVERRHRLVADQQLGVDRQRAGDADALALAAGELVRIAPRVLRSEPDHVQELRDPPRALASLRQSVDGQRLADHLLHRHARIQGGIRVLEDHLHLAPQRPQVLGIGAGHVPALEQDLTPGRLQQAQQQAPDGGLAGAALPDQSHALAAAQGEAHPVDRVHGAGAPGQQARANGKVLGEVAHLHQRGFGGRGRGAHGCPAAARAAPAVRIGRKSE